MTRTLSSLREQLQCAASHTPTYSQAEEDAVLWALVGLLDLPRGTFVEIGVGGGYECNTRRLADEGWTGLWIGDEPLTVAVPTGVEFHQTMVTPEQLRSALMVQAFKWAAAPTVDLFSIDIDGNDYWVAKAAIPLLDPTIVIVEFNNAAAGVMPYTPGYRWHQGQPFGASLAAWQALLSDYALVYTTRAQVNAIFVHQRVFDAVAVRGAETVGNQLDDVITMLDRLSRRVESNETRPSAEQICGVLAVAVTNLRAVASAASPEPPVELPAGSADDWPDLAGGTPLAQDVSASTEEPR